MSDALTGLVDDLTRRDRERRESISPYGDTPSIEDRLWLADERAKDALIAVGLVIRHILDGKGRDVKALAWYGRKYL